LADGSLALSPCHIPGLQAESFCGSITVLEDRSAQSGRTIELDILVVPAISANPEPDPLFFLAGGPGQAAREVAAQILPALRTVQESRDLVFVDQRGTGAENVLNCDLGNEDPLDSLSEDLPLDEIAACLDGLEADPLLYTTPVAMDDLDDVRTALGVDKINLYGVSYGTRASLVYLRRHPDRVRSMVLDGVAPTTMAVGADSPVDAQAALDALIADCQADEHCRSAFPEQQAELDALIAATVEPIPIRIPHPRTGSLTDVSLGQDALTGGIRGILYSPALASLLPLAIHTAHEGNYGPLVTQMTGFSDGITNTISFGMMLSVLCAEDVPRYTEADFQRARETFVGDVGLESMAEACAIWPAATMPPDYFQPVSSDVPVLILSGAIDPVTPPRWGDAAAEHLSNSRHVVVDGLGHNVAPYGCLPKLLGEFVETVDAAALDVSCTERIERPPFFLDTAGTAP